MKTILVTTDFSQNSIAAVRLAIELACKGSYAITFFHVCHLMQPTLWNDHKYQSYEKRNIILSRKKLKFFINEVFDEIDGPPITCKYDIINAAPASKGIMQYAKQHKFDFICISTNGASRFRRMLGSVVSQLVNHCDTQLIIVPARYRPGSIGAVVWASDFSNIEKEIKQVDEFTRSITTNLILLHLLGAEDANIDSTLTEQMIKKRTDYPVKLILKLVDWSKPLTENIQTAVQNLAPCLLVMFSNQHKTMLEKILFPSVTAAYLFNSVTPLVIFKK